MFRTKKVLWGLLSLFFLSLALYFLKTTLPFFSFSEKYQLQNQYTLKQHPKSPEIIIQNFNIKEISKDKKDIWILTSKEGKIFKKLNQIECTDTFCLLKKNNQDVAILKSKKSLLDQNSKSLFLYGPVSGNFKELEFYGQDLNYSFSKHTIKTNQQLTCWYSNFNLCAQAGSFNLKKNKIEMKGGVKTEISHNTTRDNG